MITYHLTLNSLNESEATFALKVWSSPLNAPMAKPTMTFEREAWVKLGRPSTIEVSVEEAKKPE